MLALAWDQMVKTQRLLRGLFVPSSPGKQLAAPGLRLASMCPPISRCLARVILSTTGGFQLTRMDSADHLSY